jgi:hypothetical protein
MNKIYKLDYISKRVEAENAEFYDSVKEVKEEIECGRINNCDDDIVIVEYQEVKRYKIVTSKPTLVEIKSDKKKKTNGKK